jgi:hypothetical protein
MDALSLLLGFIFGFTFLPCLIGVVVLCQKFNINVSLEPLKRLLNKIRNRN